MIYKASVLKNGNVFYEEGVITSSWIEYMTMLNGYAKVTKKVDEWTQGHKTIDIIDNYYIDSEFNFDTNDVTIIDIVNKIKASERDKKISALLK
jgi:hypothetical protein